MRKGQDNQTLGIPVGPNTSRVLAEIIGVAIDRCLEDTLGLDASRAFRHIDDWYIGFDNAGEAEDAIATLAAACRDYELELNAEKTQTLNAYGYLDRAWSTELREHKFGRSESAQAKAPDHYFVKPFELAKNNPTSNVIDCAVKRTMNISVKPGNWRSYETFLLKAARSNATVIPAVVEIMVSCNHSGYDLDKERIKKLVADLIRRNAPPAHHSEVAWALFLAKALKIVIPNEVSEAVSQLESSVCGLLALDLEQKGLVNGSLDKSLWQRSMAREGLRSSMWLLAYEADLKGWLVGNPADFVREDVYFGPMKRKRIFFYDERRNVTHIRKRKPRPRSAAFIDFLRALRGREPVVTGLGVSMSGY